MELTALAPSYIRALAPYQPGKPVDELARELGLDEKNIVKLASNENPLGMGMRARQAVLKAIDDVGRYPDGNGFMLKQALSRRFGIAESQIVLGNGSNDVLELVVRTFLRPGTSAVYSQYAFTVYSLLTQAVGARGIEVPAVNWAHDLAAMRAAIADDTRIVFIANPNNPTGTLLPPDELEGFIASVPPQILVVLDEAYTEYLDEGQAGDSFAWQRKYPNLIVTRTFSKAYGLAGLRVGFAVCTPELAELMNRLRQPFNVNILAHAAAAAALDDVDFLEESRRLNRLGMTQLVLALEAFGFEVIPSHGNFLAFHCRDAAGLNRFLLENGVIVRPLGAYGLHDMLRVSVGLPAENARFIEVLRAAPMR